jgi:hypothetical protein
MNYTNFFFLGGGGAETGEWPRDKDDVREWLEGLVATLFDEGIPKLVQRYKQCHNVHGDNVEK